MDSIISSAAKYTAEREALYKEFGEPKILVVGCGGAGNNSINRLHKIGVHGAETIAVNTDKQHLDITEANKKILIGKNITKGLGAGGHPEIGEDAADQAKDVLEEVLGEADLVFIAAGMGGGTGTGAIPLYFSAVATVTIGTLSIVEPAAHATGLPGVNIIGPIISTAPIYGPSTVGVTVFTPATKLASDSMFAVAVILPVTARSPVNSNPLAASVVILPLPPSIVKVSPPAISNVTLSVGPSIVMVGPASVIISTLSFSASTKTVISLSAL